MTTEEQTLKWPIVFEQPVSFLSETTGVAQPFYGRDSLLLYGPLLHEVRSPRSSRSKRTPSPQATNLYTPSPFLHTLFSLLILLPALTKLVRNNNEETDH